jgi:hypothetical protein
VRRRIRGYEETNFFNSKLIQGTYGYRPGAPFGFGRESSAFGAMGSYGIIDRMARYTEFSEMEYMPEIASSLDLYADECIGGDDRGKFLNVFSNNIQIKKALEELFYEVLNVSFNLRLWVRNLTKYGDFFLYNEVLPEQGIVMVHPIPVNQIERLEAFDESDPYAVKFRWLTRGNTTLENWQVTHFRIMGNDQMLPYGTSILETARRVSQQLRMMEDAMLVYRVIRSPERRVFYIDVAALAPNDIPSYMEAQKSQLRSHSVIDRSDGRQDLRFNPVSIEEDYFIPVRGNQSGTKIDTLAGGQHVTATEDVEYIRSKIFAAVKVPKPFINFDENLSAKASLAQQDVRFSRTITSLQRIVLAELNKLAMIHLYAKGFDGEDLINFELKLSNPSSVAMQQKLELWATRVDIAGTAKETRLVDEKWIQRNLLDFTDDDIDTINRGLYEDRVRETQLEAFAFESEESRQTTTDPFDSANYQMSGQGVLKEPQDEPPGSAGTPSFRSLSQVSLDTDEGSSETQQYRGTASGSLPPVRPTPFIDKHRYDRGRRKGVLGSAETPDFGTMLSPTKNRYLRDINDDESTRNLASEGTEYRVLFDTGIPRPLKSTFENLKRHLERKRRESGLLTEEVMSLPSRGEEFEIDVDIEVSDLPEFDVGEEDMLGLEHVVDPDEVETAEDSEEDVEILFGMVGMTGKTIPEPENDDEPEPEEEQD